MTEQLTHTQIHISPHYWYYIIINGNKLTDEKLLYGQGSMQCSLVLLFSWSATHPWQAYGSLALQRLGHCQAQKISPNICCTSKFYDKVIAKATPGERRKSLKCITYLYVLGKGHHLIHQQKFLSTDPSTPKPKGTEPRKLELSEFKYLPYFFFYKKV